MSVRRATAYVASLAVAGLLAVGGLGATEVAPAAAADRPEVRVRATPLITPNGDGVTDEAVVRYTLTRGDRPRAIVYRAHGSRPLKTVELGKKAPGTHRWVWNGRIKGRVLDGEFRIAIQGRLHKERAAPVVVDTTFDPTVVVVDGTNPAAVHPRSQASRDLVVLRASAPEPPRDGALRFRIRDPRGRVVLDRLADEVVQDDGLERAELTWDAWHRGRPLPRGRYSVEVSGQDEHGNRGSSRRTGERVRIWVSGDRVVERVESFVVAPADGSWPASCGIDQDGGNGCSDPEYLPCGTIVPSESFPGGLSHRAGQCPAVAQANAAFATSEHHLEFPDAVRVSAVRVAFSGAPTEAGSTVAGTLTVGSERVTSSSGGSSGWVTETDYQAGHWSDRWEKQTLPPTAYWTFHTAGDDAFDVASFRVDVRYLVVRG